MRRTLGLVVLALALCSTAPAAARAPTASPLAITAEQGGGMAFLSRLDPVTLERRDPRVHISEWHGGYSFSPDGRRVALTVSRNPSNPIPRLGRVGIELVEHATGAVTEVQTGVAAGAVAWLTPNRLVGIVQGGTVVLVDTDAGRVIRGDQRVRADCIDPPGKGATRRALVVLLGDRVHAIDRNGAMRSATLRGMDDRCGRLGFAVDEARERAYAVGLGSRVAEVNLRTMRVTYRALPRAAARGTSLQASALLLGDRRLAVAHAVFSRGNPKGVEVVDVRRGTRRVIDPGAGRVILAGSRLITWDGHYAGRRSAAQGIRVFDRAGRPLFGMLGGERVEDVQVLGRFAYALVGGGRLRVVDLATRSVVSRSAHGWAEVAFLSR